MLTWCRYPTAFGDGAVVCTDERLVRVLLPVGAKGDVARQVRRESPDAIEATGKTGQLAGRMARALSAAFEGKALPPWVLESVQWPQATAFQLAVLRACAAIPSGKVLSYGELAAAARFPGRARAAGTVMATNPLPIVVPCHRVVRSDGSLGNYGGGTDMKAALLAAEGFRPAA
ncbi:MAG: MGMT family protein [Candidatus Sumerlaeia bacterium]|nr:MGMT family protein [Candidatus Sumerlaeia bacterium]